MDLLRRLKRELQRHYTHLRPRNVAVLLTSLLALGDADAGFVGDLLHVSLGLLPDFEPGDLAGAVHALAGLGVQPSREWMARFYAACAARWPDWDARALASAAWSLGALRKRPPAGWLEGFCDAADAQWGAFTAQGVANVAWGLAVLRARPPARWMRRLVRASERLAPQMSPQGAANLLWWACCKRRRRPAVVFAKPVACRALSSA